MKTTKILAAIRAKIEDGKKRLESSGDEAEKVTRRGKNYAAQQWYDVLMYILRPKKRK